MLLKETKLGNFTVHLIVFYNFPTHFFFFIKAQIKIQFYHFSAEIRQYIVKIKLKIVTK